MNIGPLTPYRCVIDDRAGAGLSSPSFGISHMALPQAKPHRLSVAPSILSEGYDHVTCWTQGRAAVLPGGRAVMTAQKLVLAGSDDSRDKARPLGNA